MKKIIWKIRFAFEIRKLLALDWRWCWDMAGSWLESVEGDMSECPLECARCERDEWAANCD